MRAQKLKERVAPELRLLNRRAGLIEADHVENGLADVDAEYGAVSGAVADHEIVSFPRLPLAIIGWIGRADHLISFRPARKWKLVARRLLADKVYDANSLRKKLAQFRTEAVIPSARSRGKPIPYEMVAYRERNRIERAFCSLKDWRRLATRYDKLARNLLSAVALAAVIIWWS